MSKAGFPDLGRDYVSPPGDLLAEELEARGMTQKALAESMGRSPKVINEIVRGKKSITADTALQLEQALGIPAHIWLRLEAAHQLSLARLRRASA
jgi:HTH-type transcriptional regulator / antitoxin HigA